MLRQIPPVVLGLIIANVAIYLLQTAVGDAAILPYALWPLHSGGAGAPPFQPYQVVTYAFLHGGFKHLFFNMFALFMFGPPLEQVWGSRRFAIYYLVSVLTAAATELMVENATQSGEPVIGASGGIFGLLLAFAWFFPRQKLLLIFFPVPMPAWLFVTLYGIAELFMGVTGAEAGVAHFAHLGGMLGGALSILYWRMRGRFSGY